jgi:hypothetical protein
MKTRICVFITLILNVNLYSQQSKNRLVNNYYQGIEYYLSPDTNDFEREILFISKPSFNSPEYSVALETNKGNPVLKLRSFKSNYWESVISMRSKDTVMVKSKIDCFVVYISKRFEDKLKSYLQAVLKDSLFSGSFDTYDGTTYLISNNKYIREVRDFEFYINKNYYQLIGILESIANNLKTGDFNEKWYSDLIDKASTTELKNNH